MHTHTHTQPSGRHTSLLRGFSVNQAGRQLLDEREGGREEGGRQRWRKGGDVHIIAGGWRRGECGSIRGESVRYSSTGGWTWTAAARRLPALTKSAGEKAELADDQYAGEAFFFSTAKRDIRSGKGKAIYMMWWGGGQIESASVRRQK